MKQRFVVASVVALCLWTMALVPKPAVADSAFPFYIASETYYRLDVPAGTMSVRVEAKIQPAKAELDSVTLWAMPGATDIVLKQGDATLETTVAGGSTEAGDVSLVTGKLTGVVRGKNTTNVVMTYVVPSQKNGFMSLEPGAIEAMFVSQDAGSFVFIDVPKGGDNHFEPGCLLATKQPKDVSDGGFVRWVCGDATLIALNTEDKGVQAQCAGLDDRCRQKPMSALTGSDVPFPFAGYAQSITDDAKKGVLEADVPMQSGNVKLTLKYFKSDAQWADREFDVAKRALPLIEQAFNFPYPHEGVSLRQSRFIGMAGAAGVAFPDEGEMLITNTGDAGFDDQVTIHELAHQWAGRNLEVKWLWEGLAEYATRTVAPLLGIGHTDRGWGSLGYTDPLATWYAGSPVMDPDYWYGKSGAFWIEFEKQIGGPDAMKAVLGRMDDDPNALPLSDRWFLDTGELVTGAKLDELFLSWVYVRERAAPLMAERRTAHDAVVQTLTRARDMGLEGVPADIRANLDRWEFNAIAGQLKTADDLLTRYAAVVQAAKDAQLPNPDSVSKSWGTATMQVTARLIEDERQAIEAIVSATTNLAGKPTDSAGQEQLREARTKFATGDFAGAEKLAVGSGTTAYNEVAAGRMIEIAREKQSSYKPSFLGRMGLFFADPAGDLTKAEEAYANGDPEKALELSKSAYDGWNGASERGLMRLAMLAGLMCAMTVGAWYLLRRLDPNRVEVKRKPLGSGHVLVDEKRGSWKDWENSGQG